MLTGAAAILYRKDEVLIVKHGESSDHPTGSYSLPGGRSEPNDGGTRYTAAREIREETGMDLHPFMLKIIDHYDFELGGKDGNRSVSVDLYECEVPLEKIVRPEMCRETTPVWVKIGDYLSGAYPITYVSKNFAYGVENFLRKVSEGKSKSL